MKHTNKPGAALCRWLARIVGTLFVLVVLSIALGQGVPNPVTQPAGVQLGLLALALILTGIVAGWKWEFAGGIISLFGWFLFATPLISSPRGLTLFVAGLALPGALYVTSALLRHYDARQLNQFSGGKG
jgi:hypothetical protein